MRQYLGDGCFVDFDGYSLILTTEDGRTATNTIFLEPMVYRELVAYVDRLKSVPPTTEKPSEGSK